MERVTLRVPAQQVREVEELVEDGRFANKSEAIRHAIHNLLYYERPLRRDGPEWGRRE